MTINEYRDTSPKKVPIYRGHKTYFCDKKRALAIILANWVRNVNWFWGAITPTIAETGFFLQNPVSCSGQEHVAHHLIPETPEFYRDEGDEGDFKRFIFLHPIYPPSFGDPCSFLLRKDNIQKLQ
jgi:hypothetical protein